MVVQIDEVVTEDLIKSKILIVKDLVTKFFTTKGVVNAIDGIDFSINSREIYGLVGESGSGKSVTASSIMDIVQDPPGRIIAGEIFIEGFNILADLQKMALIDFSHGVPKIKKRNKKAIKYHNSITMNIRGKLASMIFQEPGLSLNPVLTVGDQISETVLQHSMTEMSEFLLARYDLTEEELEKELLSLIETSDKQKLKTSVRYLCRKYGTEELSEKILSSITRRQNIDVLKKELYEQIKKNISTLDVSVIEELMDYYKAQDELWKLKSRLEEAKRKNQEDEADIIEGKIDELNSYIRSNFSLLPIKRRLRRKQYRDPYMEISMNLALEMLKLVGIMEPERILKSYPHELSGGMQQRVMIAMALSTDPRLLIADEPTTALDVTTQAQILDLIKDLREVVGSSVLFITHDLAVIAEMCDRVGVMYAGNIVEESDVKEIFNNPKHPYTAGLLESIPRPSTASKKLKFNTIPGTVPNLITPPEGCRFHPRCKFAMDICSITKPKLVEISEGHKVACYLYSGEVEQNE